MFYELVHGVVRADLEKDVHILMILKNMLEFDDMGIAQ